MRIRTWLREELSVRALPNIRPQHIAFWRDQQLAAGKAPTTIRNMLTIVSQVFEVARSEWGLEELHNPVKAIRLPRLRRGRDRRLEPGELERLLRVADPVLGAAIVLAVETALRRGELLALRWADVQGRAAVVREGKDGRRRAVPLSSRARAALEALEALEGAGEHVVPLSAPLLRKRWEEACRKAGVEGLRWHDLRHEAVSRLFERGLTAEEVMQVSGHRTYAMLARYTHLRLDGLAAKLG